jgi:hypothetical protein
MLLLLLLLLLLAPWRRRLGWSCRSYGEPDADWFIFDSSRGWKFWGRECKEREGKTGSCVDLYPSTVEQLSSLAPGRPPSAPPDGAVPLNTIKAPPIPVRVADMAS